MNQEIDLLKIVVKKLDSASIPYMMTGSLAMALYAIPRMQLRDVRQLLSSASDLDEKYLQKWSVILE